MSKVAALIRSTRPLNSFMTGFAVTATYMVSTHYTLNPLPIVIGFVSGYLASSAAMLVNDYVDYKVDRIIKPWKPIPRGILSRDTVLYASIIALATAQIINIFISFKALLTVVILSLIAYSYSFLRRYWWSHFIVSLSTAAPFIYGYVLAGTPIETLLFNTLFIITVFLINTAREFVKAAADVEGDAKVGYVTVATRYGVYVAVKSSFLLSIAGTMTAIIAGVLGGANIIYLIILSIAGLLYTIASYNAYRDPKPRNCVRAKNAMIALMMLALIGYTVSKIKIP